MPEVVLAVEPREARGSAAVRRLRHAGRVPGVVYGHGDEPLAVSVDARALRAALSSEAGENALFDLLLEGRSHLAIARELQRHPVRHTIAHVDFQVVNRDEQVHADVPILLGGDPSGVTRQGGTIEQVLMTLHVQAPATAIPAHVEADVTGLLIGNSLRLAEVVLPAGVSSDVDPDTVVATALPPRVTAVETGEAAEAEGES